jgi:L-fuculose-phosphate aldolase
MAADRGLRSEVIATCAELHRRGWVANHDGNVTVRLGGGRILATPTATSKGRLGDRDLIEVDSDGKRVSGTGRPFGELGMHLAVYRARDDVNAVVHAHPPHATAIACSGHNLLDRPFIAEAVVSLGPAIPLLAFAPPGPRAAEALGACAGDADVALLANHGVFAWGADLEQATLRLELVEHLARIALLAQPLGGIRALPDDALPALLSARARAGLGKAADRAADAPAAARRVFACAPAPHSPVEVVSGSSGSGEHGPRAALVSAIREEVLRALREK